jgi:hypothetical protein
MVNVDVGAPALAWRIPGCPAAAGPALDTVKAPQAATIRRRAQRRNPEPFR